MSKSIKNIQLAFPCKEDWNNMPDDEKGKFCEKCKSRVFDFRGKSKEELQNEIIHSAEPICGRFNKSQLSSSFLKYAASAVIASGLAIPAMSQQPIPTDRSELIDDNEAIFGMMEIQPYPKGGWKSFYERLSQEIRVPIDLETKTKVYVEFVIDTTGRMVDIKVVKSDDPRLNKEAIRALEALSEKFVPGMQRGVSVRVKQALLIWFDPKKD
jgi:TonB family protein